MSKFYEIYIFTAAEKVYAEAIIDFLDPEYQFVDGVINRNGCIMTNSGKFIKDLRIIKNRDLKNMILVDNSSYSFGKTYENCIPILNFFNNDNDDQLLHLQDYLIELSKVDDVRIVNKDRFKLEYITKNLQKLIY